MNFGTTIKEARRKKGINQRVLAEAIGCNFTYVSKIENNKADYPPSDEVLKSLSEVLGLEFELLHRISGKVFPEDYRIFVELVRTNPDVLPLFRRMYLDPQFARFVFNSL